MRQYEVVDGILDPQGVLNCGKRRTAGGNESPVRSGRGDLRAEAVWPLRALFNPSLDECDLSVGQASTHRHAGDIADAGHPDEERTLLGLAGNQHSGEGRLPRVQSQVGHLVVGPMAHIARLLKYGLDIAGEINLL